MPEPDEVAGGVAKGGDGEQPFGRWWVDDLAAVGDDPCGRLVDLVYVDVEQQPRLAGDGMVADPRAAQVAAGVVEA